LREHRATCFSSHRPLYTIATVTESFSRVQRCELEHQIGTGDRLVADAKSVLVGYDYTVGASVPLTENQKRRLAA
jgi:hypothetical protein